MAYIFSDEFIDTYILYRNIFKSVEIPEGYTIKHKKCDLMSQFLTIDKACSVTHMNVKETVSFYNNSQMVEIF